MKDITGFILVIISAFPMGIAEGMIINMQENYILGRVIPAILLYLLGFGLYLFGFMQIPTKIGFIVGVWEISAVTISVTYAITKHAVKFDKEYLILYIVLIAATYILGLAADRIFMKAGIE